MIGLMIWSTLPVPIAANAVLISWYGKTMKPYGAFPAMGATGLNNGNEYLSNALTSPI
jgi:hypothetical protein